MLLKSNIMKKINSKINRGNVSNYIYKITNILNGNIYIGSSKDPVKRFGNHIRSRYNRNTRIALELREYNKKTFRMDIIHYCYNDDDPIKLERCFIIYYIKSGYNLLNSLAK